MSFEVIVFKVFPRSSVFCNVVDFKYVMNRGELCETGSD